jgi:hypothetical protein
MSWWARCTCSDAYIVGSTYGLFGGREVQIPYLGTLVGKKAGEGVVRVVALGTVVPSTGIKGARQNGFELSPAHDAHFGHQQGDVVTGGAGTVLLHPPQGAAQVDLGGRAIRFGVAQVQPAPGGGGDFFAVDVLHIAGQGVLGIEGLDAELGGGAGVVAGGGTSSLVGRDRGDGVERFDGLGAEGGGGAGNEVEDLRRGLGRSGAGERGKRGCK